jgi:hypothetical protein
MTTAVDDLREGIACLERERPQSRLLQDFKRQLADWEAGQGRTAEQMYYAGNPVVPKSNAAADPMQPAMDGIEAFWNKKHAQHTAQQEKVRPAQSESTTATKDEAGL